ncbi:MAG: DnaB-like helicase C-terminal domain-containing protein, partial [Candidatus Limnocylindria bacterium]
VQAELAASGELDAVGGAQLLVGLMQNVPTVAHAETYATMVERTALLRRLIGTATEIARLALTRDDAEATVDEAQRLLFAVSESHLHRDVVALDHALRRYAEQIAARGDEQPGVPTGLASLDGKTGGLQPSDLVILAGRPGLGKTSLALCFVAHAALQAGRTCAVFSLEMSELQLVQRLISMTAEIEGNRMRRGILSMEELGAISQASSRLQQAAIFVEEATRLTVTDILAKSRRLQAERGLDLVVVDYLQLIEGVGGDEDNRVLEVAKISRSLKAIARELQVPVVALSQLSRQIEIRATEPMLSDLRECVTGDTRVIDADTGRPVEIRALLPGVKIIAADGAQQLGSHRVADVWCTGVKPIFRLRSRTGHEIRATANHPFLTPRGWRQLGDLEVGDVVATARRLPKHGPERPERGDLCRLLGYMAGEGAYQRHRGIGFALPRELSTHLRRLHVGRKDQHETMRRSTALRYAERTADRIRRDYAESDLLWEPVAAIEPAGEQEVYDLRVPEAANFLANGFVVHNSGALEADADLVMFLWQKDAQDRKDGLVRLKLAKHRNGPTADIDLHFESDLTRFRDLGESRGE